MQLSSILSISVTILGEVLGYLILIRCIISFLPITKGNFLTSAIYNLTEPILSPIRRLTQRFSGGMMLDFSPIIAWLLIDYVFVPLIIRLIFFIFR